MRVTANSLSSFARGWRALVSAGEKQGRESVFRFLVVSKRTRTCEGRRESEEGRYERRAEGEGERERDDGDGDGTDPTTRRGSYWVQREGQGDTMRTTDKGSGERRGY